MMAIAAASSISNYYRCYINLTSTLFIDAIIPYNFSNPADEFYDLPEVSDLVATLQASDWYTIGLKLNVPTFQLDNIKSNYKSYKEQKQEMFRAWLETLRENGIEPIGIASIDSPT